MLVECHRRFTGKWWRQQSFLSIGRCRKSHIAQEYRIVVWNFSWKCYVIEWGCELRLPSYCLKDESPAPMSIYYAVSVKESPGIVSQEWVKKGEEDIWMIFCKQNCFLIFNKQILIILCSFHCIATWNLDVSIPSEYVKYF